MHRISFLAIVAISFALLTYPPAHSSTELGPHEGALQTETFLHPMDGFTGFTLKKGEFIYNQSPFTLPLPSWAWWGVTDWLTAEIDFLPLIGGFFIEPHLPVPSFNFRFKIQEGRQGLKPWLAFETMVQYLYKEHKQFDLENLVIERQGASWYNRLNASFQLTPRTFLHMSGGATYSHRLLIKNKNRTTEKSKLRKDQIFPDASVSFDHRPRPWLTLHLTASYGTTFVYLDNIPNKYQVAYGFRIAPFLKSSEPIFRALRAEFTALYIYFPDANEELFLPIPIFPYAYWQWTW